MKECEDRWRRGKERKGDEESRRGRREERKEGKE